MQFFKLKLVLRLKEIFLIFSLSAFNMVSIEIPKKDREFSIAITSIADSFGITLAGFTSIPVHNAICNYGNK